MFGTFSSYPSYISQLNQPDAFTSPSSCFSFCFFHVVISYILFRDSLPWLLPLLPPSPANQQGHFSWCMIIEFNTFCSIQSLSRVQLLQSHGLQHARPPCPSSTPRGYPNSCPLTRWCHPTISSSVISFSYRFQSFPDSGSFQISQFFASGG